ncbi:hypothetical protein [Rhodococcus jostii]|uniref:hypothetical protein n=1 Tax=Rhodococcus jostii TaxID=132919 RepID=UPI00364FF56E
MSAVVEASRLRPGEADVPSLAPVEQIVIDELAVVVRVDPEEWERPVLAIFSIAVTTHWRAFVGERTVLGRAGGDVGDRQ